MTFYTNFAAAYGTCWMAIMVIAQLRQMHIDTVAFGFFGFPLVSLVYAYSRQGTSKSKQVRRQMREKRFTKPLPDATDAV